MSLGGYGDQREGPDANGLEVTKSNKKQAGFEEWVKKTENLEPGPPASPLLEGKFPVKGTKNI